VTTLVETAHQAKPETEAVVDYKSSTNNCRQHGMTVLSLTGDRK